MADGAPDGMHGRYQSLSAAHRSAGMVVTPPIGGALFTLGSTPMWVGGGLLGLAGTALLVALWPRLPATAVDVAPSAAATAPVRE